MKKQKNDFLDLTKTEKSLYIRILIWAYNKRENGFRWNELKNLFNLSREQAVWVDKMFRANGAEIIGILSYDSNEHIYMITAEGVSAAISYLDLKEAERSGKRAEKIALTAIIVGIVVGLLQIVITIYYK